MAFLICSSSEDKPHRAIRDDLFDRPIVLGHVINHRSTTRAGVTLAVYSQYTYEREKREALELWAERLLAIVGGKAPTVPPCALLTPVETPHKHRGLRPLWKQGESGNPTGRPKGSRNKLSEEFVAELYADWCQHGAGVLKTVRETKPDVYLKIVASLLAEESSGIQVHHVIKRIKIQEGQMLSAPVLELEAIQDDGADT